MNIIEVKNLNVKYNEHIALKNINMTVKEKEYIYTKDINVNKFAKNFVKVEDGVVYIKAKYNLTSDICFVFKKRGGNNLVDFYNVFTTL